MASTVWKGHIAFGLVSIPVKLSCAARAESISFCQLRASDHSRVGQSLFAKADSQPVTKDEIVKGFEVRKDAYIVITPEEISAAAPVSDHNAEILEFVPASQVDPGWYEQSYWLAPDLGDDKAYALLFDGLQRSGFVGIAKLAMGNREHLIVLRAAKTGIAVHTLFYSHEARQEDEYRTDLSRISEQESELAGMLMTALAADFEFAKFRDSYRENLLALIEAKTAGQEAPTAAKPVPKAAASNVMDALRASLLAKKVTAAPGPVAVPAPVAEAAAPRKRIAKKTGVAA